MHKKKDTKIITIKNHVHIGAEGVKDIITNKHKEDYMVSIHIVLK